MKKQARGPWYGIIWIIVWTGALVWFYWSGIFNNRELMGLTVVWAVLVGMTVYFIARRINLRQISAMFAPKPEPVRPSLNAACPCGSGKKYKRCCAVSDQGKGK
jgi:hypothetical protein